MLASRTEASNERSDRTWRRWSSFCQRQCQGLSPILSGVPTNDSTLLFKGFFELLRAGRFKVSGEFRGLREKPVVGSTLRSARGDLSAAFKRRILWSPLHLPTNQDALLPELELQFRAFDNEDPPAHQQKAISPKFLRILGLIGSHRIQNSATDQAVDLLIGGYFFACRICEIVKTPISGRTKKCRLRNFCFRTKGKTVIPLGQRILEAFYITITFEDQKNGEKLEKRTQRRTVDPSLCPVLRFGRAILRILKFVPNANLDTFVCATASPEVRTTVITSEFTLKTIRSGCEIGGGERGLGFRPADIGNRSIRSGAAMALFLTNKHPTRIMLLGRWKSLAFLKYIRAQTLEWTLNMSDSMIDFDHFEDLTAGRRIEKNQEIVDNFSDKDWRQQVIPRTRLNF